MRTLRVFATIVSAATLASCGGAGGGGGYDSPTTPTQPSGGGNPSTPVSTSVISLTAANSFSPSNVQVPAGTTVTWKWSGCSPDGYGGYSGCVSHSVTFDDGSNISSPTQDSGSFARTFTTPGTYKYHCAIHGAGMSGQIIVQ